MVVPALAGTEAVVMIWFWLTLGGVVLGLGALYWWGRSDDGGLDEMPPLVPSGRNAHRARAFEILMNKGNGSGDAAGPGGA